MSLVCILSLNSRTKRFLGRQRLSFADVRSSEWSASHNCSSLSSQKIFRQNRTFLLMLTHFSKKKGLTNWITCNFSTLHVFRFSQILHFANMFSLQGGNIELQLAVCAKQQHREITLCRCCSYHRLWTGWQSRSVRSALTVVGLSLILAGPAGSNTQTGRGGRMPHARNKLGVPTNKQIGTMLAIPIFFDDSERRKSCPLIL